MTNEQAEEFAREWYEAWNARDLDRIMGHWSDDAVFTSPLAAQLLGQPSGTVEGKSALRAYWQKGLEANPDRTSRPGLSSSVTRALCSATATTGARNAPRSS